ncbi:MAG: ABC transporter ATP-binding protein [Lysobacterales bacterium CG02_land_8_20_14_3_00_62_12]|nr:MAG: ABC transporter ATP-binding protein [Xanthomonadales bacterium CG02_land_8_20_14_3_00_62_12]
MTAPSKRHLEVRTAIDPLTPSTVPADLVFDDVRIERGGRVILDHLSFRLPHGSITAVLGPSGAGKSTLLHAITGELVPSHGHLSALGVALAYRRRDLLALRRRIGVLLQGNGLLSDLTVAENIALPLRMHTRLSDALILRLVQLKLNAVGLVSALDLYPRELSGGMARRVAFARALALDPPLMLYDEPLTGLDPIAIGVIVSLIAGLNKILNMTSVIITHHVQQSLSIADRVLVLANGGLAFDGTPAMLYASTDPLLLQFLRGEPDGPIAFDASRNPLAVAA